MAALTTQKADVDKQVAVLSHALETTKAELKTAQDKVAFLTDENKVILQEKAVIQGQFKQLQSSLLIMFEMIAEIPISKPGNGSSPRRPPNDFFHKTLQAKEKHRFDQRQVEKEY